MCFLTALGGDLFAQGIERELRELDIDLSCALRLPRSTPRLTCLVADERGDMLCAINDMAIYRHQTVDYFARHLDRLNRAGR